MRTFKKILRTATNFILLVLGVVVFVAYVVLAISAAILGGSAYVLLVLASATIGGIKKHEEDNALTGSYAASCMCRREGDIPRT